MWSQKHFIIIIVASVLLLRGLTFGQEHPCFTEVYSAGKDGFASIRIPSMIASDRGTLLAIAEGRARPADQANNKIILKRSWDVGRTWGATQVIADGGINCLNNPCAVVDGQSGRIIVMFQSYPTSYSERNTEIMTGTSGSNIVRNCLVYSIDDGATWSAIKDVTATTKRPDGISIMASGPGIGIQLHRGIFKNRIVIPFNEGKFGMWKMFCIYSDDGGKNWNMGQDAPGCYLTNDDSTIISVVNEVQMAELSDGSVMVNCRNWGGRAFRKKAVSLDGGATWSKIQDETNLPDFGCMASIFHFVSPMESVNDCLMFSGPDSLKRHKGVIHLSYDDGKTWPIKTTFYPGDFAYSVLAEMPNGTMGCLFETDQMTRIIFGRFSIAWVVENGNRSP